MKELVERLDAWFVSQGTSLRLAPPATPEALAAAEAALGWVLPEDYRELLLAHDGQEKEEVSWLSTGGRFRAIGDCVEEWERQQGSIEPSNPEPLTDDGCFY
jgi:cell wall assembly regulator SMI1